MADVDINPNFGLELKVGACIPLWHDLINMGIYRMPSNQSIPGLRMGLFGWTTFNNSTANGVSSRRNTVPS